MRWLVAALSGGALACGDNVGPGATSGPIRIDPDASAYLQGATVNLMITNLSRETLDYNACFYHIERQAQGGEWHLVYEVQNPCPAVLEYLEPFASREASVIVPADAAFAPHRARYPAIGVRRGDEKPFIPAAQVGDSFVVQP